MSEIYYSVYLNKTDGELYAVMDSVKPPKGATIVLALPVYKILKDKQLVKNKNPESLLDLKIDLEKENKHLKMVGSIYLEEAGAKPDFHLEDSVPHPMLDHLEEEVENFFVYSNGSGTDTFIPYTSISYFSVFYEKNKLSTVKIFLTANSVIQFKVSGSTEHNLMIKKLKDFKKWKVKNESKI